MVGRSAGHDGAGELQSALADTQLERDHLREELSV